MCLQLTKINIYRLYIKILPLCAKSSFALLFPVSHCEYINDAWRVWWPRAGRAVIFGCSVLKSNTDFVLCVFPGCSSFFFGGLVQSIKTLQSPELKSHLQVKDNLGKLNATVYCKLMFGNGLSNKISNMSPCLHQRENISETLQTVKWNRALLPDSF